MGEYVGLGAVAAAAGCSVKDLKNWNRRGIIAYPKSSHQEPVILNDTFVDKLRTMKTFLDGGVRLHYAATRAGFLPVSSPKKIGRPKGARSIPVSSLCRLPKYSTLLMLKLRVALSESCAEEIDAHMFEIYRLLLADGMTDAAMVIARSDESPKCYFNDGMTRQ